MHKARIFYKKWINFYPEISEIHCSIKKILDLQVQKYNFIFSVSKSSIITSLEIEFQLNKIIKNRNSDHQKMMVLGITDTGLKRYTCMPSINSETGLGLFPILYTSNSAEPDKNSLPSIISILYYWKRLGCSLKKLNFKNVDVKNELLPWGSIISFKDSNKVYDLLLLDSRIFVVLVSGLKEYSSLVNEHILSDVLKIWSF